MRSRNTSRERKRGLKIIFTVAWVPGRHVKLPKVKDVESAEVDWGSLKVHPLRDHRYPALT